MRPDIGPAYRHTFTSNSSTIPFAHLRISSQSRKSPSGTLSRANYRPLAESEPGPVDLS